MDSLQNIREWISFAFLVIGGGIAIRVYILNQRQRKLENSFKLVDFINRSIRKGDIENWHTIFVASSNSAGAKTGHFVHGMHQLTFDVLFAEGSPDQGATERFCELFNLMGYEYQKRTIDLRIIFFEFGQFIMTVHSWVTQVPQKGPEPFIKEHYPYYDKVVRDNRQFLSNLPSKTISHIE